MHLFFQVKIINFTFLLPSWLYLVTLGKPLEKSNFKSNFDPSSLLWKKIVVEERINSRSSGGVINGSVKNVSKNTMAHPTKIEVHFCGIIDS